MTTPNPRAAASEREAALDDAIEAAAMAIAKDRGASAGAALVAELTARGFEVVPAREDRPDLRQFLELTPSGFVGPDKVPWFIHCGISHGANRPDCIVCIALEAPE